MAVMELGSFTNGSTGNTTLNLTGTFTPTYIDFWVGPRTNTTETKLMHSIGAVDITNGNQTALSTFANTSDFLTKATSSSCITHYNPGNTKIIDATFVSAAAGSFTINLTTANASYRVYFRAYG